MQSQERPPRRAGAPGGAVTHAVEVGCAGHKALELDQVLRRGGAAQAGCSLSVAASTLLAEQMRFCTALMRSGQRCSWGLASKRGERLTSWRPWGTPC